MYTLTDEQLVRTCEAAIRARDFVESRGAELPAAIINHHWFDGDPRAVVVALAAYQNPDGGFGNRLEPDIHHPSSNPFAARIAMQMTGDLPYDLTRDMLGRLENWLAANQDEDGDWHFSDATRSGFLQPWFAGWEFPSLNPAACLAGYAARSDIATPEMLARVAALWEARASIDEARTGAFYAILPYVEYLRGVEVPEQKAYCEALANNITTTAGRTDGYADASHFFEHVLHAPDAVIDRIEPSVFATNVDRLLDEQSQDGGWPTPYDDAWRPWATSAAMTFLACLRR